MLNSRNEEDELDDYERIEILLADESGSTGNHDVNGGGVNISQSLYDYNDQL
jgi:hypothetical protein